MKKKESPSLTLTMVTLLVSIALFLLALHTQMRQPHYEELIRQFLQQVLSLTLPLAYVKKSLFAVLAFMYGASTVLFLGGFVDMIEQLSCKKQGI